MSSQRIRYQRATDGVRFARAEAGTGPVIVKAANWLTHRVRVGKPCMAPLDAVLLGHFRFVRYDERGCGMTDWNTSDLSFDRQLADLGAVVEAAGRREPFTLLGISQGGTQCIRYAVRHPERVTCLISTAPTRRGGPAGKILGSGVILRGHSPS